MNADVERSPGIEPAQATRTLLVVWEFGAHLGHLARLCPIAQTMLQIGWRIVFVVAHVAAGAYLAKLGYAWRLAPTMRHASARSGPVLNFADMLLRVGFELPHAAAETVHRWQRLFDALQPEAILIDESPLALYAAHAWGLPTIVLGHGFEIPPPLPPLPCLAPWQWKAKADAMACEAALDACIVEMSQRVAVRAEGTATRHLGQLYRPDATALCTWPELDHLDRPGTRLDQYVGPIWSDLPLMPDAAWPQKAGAKVLCYLNLVDKRFDPLWQALTRRGANVLVISPAGNPQACAAARGWGIEVLEHAVQVCALLHDAAVVVGHGGMGITAMALAAGKPLLLLPAQMEQFILAHRLCKRGLAIATVRHHNKQVIEELVEQLLAPDTRTDAAAAFVCRYGNHQPKDSVEKVKQALLRAHMRRSSYV